MLAFFLGATSEPSSASDRFMAQAGHVTLSVSRETGRFDLAWGDACSIRDAFGEAKLTDERVLRTDSAERHAIRTLKLKDDFGEGVKVTVRHLAKGAPELRHTFWLYKERSEALVRLDLIDPAGIGTNMLAPAVASKATLTGKGPLQSLFVPYDNDNYFRYSSNGWGEGEGNELGSYEVGSLYDDISRRGLVVGSVDHDQWKSAIRFHKGGGVRVVAGASSKYTHDKHPHGTVAGQEVRSPRFVFGLYDDWRKGLERFGDLNAKVTPPLKWEGEVPFGWNSWSGHKTKVQAKDSDAALEFVRDQLPWLRTGGTAFINFDSFWDNLTREQRVDFVKKAHASGLKAGIYWTPFVNWGEPDWKTVGGYHFRDLQLKDSKGEFLPKLDGGWPLDPTHPGTLQRIDENLKDFLDQGFDYIKLDFMTHGALEGKHFDPKVTTGTAAYHVGMKRLVDGLSRKKAGRPFFISLSIAPMFPHGYAHSRRISCDIFSNIGASEYFLNSQNYGWWTAGRLYRFNDPDSACVYQALGEDPTTEAEARTRFTASVIGGGMMIEGDDLTNPNARERVLRIFSNKAALKLAAEAPSFWPVRGDTAERAGDLFVHHQSDDVVYVAAFNFSKTESRKEASKLHRLDLKGDWEGEDLWTGKKVRVMGQLDLTLAPTDCALLRLTRTK